MSGKSKPPSEEPQTARLGGQSSFSLLEFAEHLGVDEGYLKGAIRRGDLSAHVLLLHRVRGETDSGQVWLKPGYYRLPAASADTLFSAQALEARRWMAGVDEEVEQEPVQVLNERDVAVTLPDDAVTEFDIRVLREEAARFEATWHRQEKTCGQQRAQGVRVARSPRERQGIATFVRTQLGKNRALTAREIWDRCPSGDAADKPISVGGYEIYRSRDEHDVEVINQVNGPTKDAAVPFNTFRRYVTRAREDLRS